jgi:putative ABC transport system permease protein
MFVHYLKIAFRNIWKYKSQTLIGVLGLTAACVVFAICCFVIFYGLSFNTSYPNYKRMYDLRTRYFQPIKGNMRQTLNELSGIEKFTAFNSGKQYNGHLLMEGNNPDNAVNLRLIEADTALWNFFSLKALKGTVQTILNSPNSIVLFESSAKKIGAPDSLQGRSIMIDEVSYTITGILKNIPTNNRYFTGDGIVFNQGNGYFQQNRDTWLPVRDVYIVVMLAKKFLRKIFKPH